MIECMNKYSICVFTGVDCNFPNFSLILALITKEYKLSIWIDADACPVVIRNIVIRAANQHQMKATFVANQPLGIKRSAYVFQWQVSQGFDKADDEIVRRLEPGDLVVTQDLRLVRQVFDKQGKALSPRGSWFDPATIDSKIAKRDHQEVLRDCGITTGGPSSLSSRDSQAFANQLQNWLVNLSQ